MHDNYEINLQMVNRLNGVAHATLQPPMAGIVKNNLFVRKVELLSPRAVECIVTRERLECIVARERLECIVAREGLMFAYEVEGILENEDNRGVDGNVVEEIK
ncbi:hypothetical protein ACFX2A_006763 [Malus domestica]